MKITKGYLKNLILETLEQVQSEQASGLSDRYISIIPRITNPAAGQGIIRVKYNKSLGLPAYADFTFTSMGAKREDVDVRPPLTKDNFERLEFQKDIPFLKDWAKENIKFA